MVFRDGVRSGTSVVTRIFLTDMICDLDSVVSLQIDHLDFSFVPTQSVTFLLLQ